MTARSEATAYPLIEIKRGVDRSTKIHCESEFCGHHFLPCELGRAGEVPSAVAG